MSVILNVKHLSGSLAGQSQRVALQEGQALRLGRNPENDIKYNEAVDELVSGVHAKLSVDRGRLYIEDQRSSNGTFVNGAQCPAFEKIAVADGSRIRLASNGPEMQVTFEAAAAETAPPPPEQDSSLPAKQSVGRETLLREINRVKEEDRDLVAAEVAKSKKSTSIWLAAGGVFLAVLIVVGAGAAYFFSTKRAEDSEKAVREEFAGVKDAVGKNVWADVEQQVSPAVAYIRCRYLFRVPRKLGQEETTLDQFQGGEAAGSGVLIRPDVLLTARHVVQPWTTIDWEREVGMSWEAFSKQTGITVEYDILDVQFPDQQRIRASVIAAAEDRDLALLSVPDRTIRPVPTAASNDAIRVTEEIAIISYPENLGEYSLFTVHFTSAGTIRRQTEVSDRRPTFLKGAISLPIATSGEHGGLFFMDAPVEQGSSGGPVLNSQGEVIGIISQRLEKLGEEMFFGRKVTTMRVVGGSIQAESPGYIQSFLRRAGVL